jgi:hypothetical protein
VLKYQYENPTEEITAAEIAQMQKYSAHPIKEYTAKKKEAKHRANAFRLFIKKELP